MTELNRRHFMQNTLAGAGALLATPAWAEESAKTAAKGGAAERVTLGKTGVVCSRLGMGTGMHGYRRQSDHTKLGQEKFTQLIRHGFDKGLNLFDMADLYGSHPFIKNALAGIPRDQYTLSTKLWFREDETFKPSGGAKEEVDRFRKELGVDTIDVVVLHCISDPQWPEQLKRACDELDELKQKGVVRAHGCSFHNFPALKVAAEHPWIDVIFARINNGGKSMDAPPEEVAAVLKKARANGKAVIGMKIFGEGKLSEPDQKDATLQYVLGNQLVDAMSIGMLTVEQVDDSIARIDKAMKA